MFNLKDNKLGVSYKKLGVTKHNILQIQNRVVWD